MKKISNPWAGREGYMCFGCSPANANGLHLEFYEDGADIVATWQPDGRFQGWLDTLHGGIQCTLLDEVAGWVVMRKMNTSGVTSRLNTRFLKSIPTTEAQLTVRARLRAIKRNLAFIDAEIYDGAGQVCARAEAIYFTVSREKAESQYHFSSCRLENE